jgi:hypothetical protein
MDEHTIVIIQMAFSFFGAWYGFKLFFNSYRDIRFLEREGLNGTRRLVAWYNYTQELIILLLQTMSLCICINIYIYDIETTLVGLVFRTAVILALTLCSYLGTIMRYRIVLDAQHHSEPNRPRGSKN